MVAENRYGFQVTYSITKPRNLSAVRGGKGKTHTRYLGKKSVLVLRLRWVVFIGHHPSTMPILYGPAKVFDMVLKELNHAGVLPPYGVNSNKRQ